jgi:hypothetical protein
MLPPALEATMGMVSYLEDIEELRQEHEHYRTAVDNLIAVLRTSQSEKEVIRTSTSIEDTIAIHVKLFESKREKAEELLEKSIALLKDPNSRIVSKLEKTIQQRNVARSERDAWRENARKSQIARQAADREIRSLKNQIKLLTNQMKDLQDQLAFASEMREVRKIRTKG